MNGGTKVTIAGERDEDLVWDVSRHVAQRARRRVREDYRRSSDPQRRLHRRRRHVTQVDQHADVIHLSDDILAEAAQTADPRPVGCRVSPWHVVVVG
jgi:hypothetical protein